MNYAEKEFIISPAYLNNDDLLSEYRKLKNKSYSELNQNFPGRYRYRLANFASEIKLRNLIEIDEDEFKNTDEPEKYPTEYYENAYKQFDLLKIRYKGKSDARISVPETLQELWRQHKYSIMARNISLYKKTGHFVAEHNDLKYFSDIYAFLAVEMQKKPSKNAVLNVLQHMWGYISNASNLKKSEVPGLDLFSFFKEIQHCVKLSGQKYLYEQIALSELGIWINEKI
ncbi:MAG: hypothetical protein CSB55_08040 [Candidatus Cloacimonadota bacterium]|nr:MAG: hypothetical protein CSB55_08040 [Candidatus Cloacimonadota bacterium]